MTAADVVIDGDRLATSLTSNAPAWVPLEQLRRKFDAGPGNVEEENGSAEEKERRYKKFAPRPA